MDTNKRAKDIKDLGQRYLKAKTESEKKTILTTMGLLDQAIKKEMGWKK